MKNATNKETMATEVKETKEKKQRKITKDTLCPKDTYVGNALLDENSKIFTESGVALEVAGLATISKVVKDSMVTVTHKELRFLVDMYQQSQALRIATDNQIRSIYQGKDGEGAEIPVSLQWVAANALNQEKQIQKMLDVWTDDFKPAVWAKSIHGIGPTLSASLVAYIDMDKAKYAGNLLSYAGLNDNNNPWLGVEKSKALIDKAKKEIYRRQKERLDIWKKYTNEEEPIIVTLENYYDPNGTYQITKAIEQDDFEFLNDYIKQGLNIKACKTILELWDAGTLAYFIENNSRPGDCATQEIIDYCALNTRRDGQRISSIVEVDEKKNYITIDALRKYFSKPPYNTELKKLCWKIGESFVKVSNKEGSLYGKIYKERKALETAKNENGDYADQAAAILAEKNYAKNTDTYKSLIEGKLSKAHINERAKRYATKLFMSHLFECMYLNKHGKPAPSPYVIEYMGHLGYVEPEKPFIY